MGRSVSVSYLVGSARGVESVCSTNKQGVVILLQEDFDEIVTLVLEGVQGGKEKSGGVWLVETFIPRRINTAIRMEVV